eukprot:989714-Pelagomonas_calceolata.AAC.1
MYDLGFPTDAIDTVKNLYENATTQRCNARKYTLTLPLNPLYGIPVKMATCRRMRLQTRLHPRPKRQNVTDTHLANVLSSAAFADDLPCPTSTIQDLKVQARKLTLYSDWAALIISGSKTKATGILHSHPGKDQNGVTPSQAL